MDISKNFNNYDFIKLNEINIEPDIKIVVLYARFMYISDDGWTFDTHSHSFYELHFPLSGKCNLVIQDSQDITLSTGASLLIHPNTNHKFTKFSSDFFRLSIAFDIQYDDKTVAESNKFAINKLSEKIQTLLNQMLTEYNNRELGYKNIFKFNIQTAMIEFLRSNTDIISIYEKQNDTRRKLFNKALIFIRNNISLNITTDDVSRYVSLSSRQLNRIFISNINMTIPEFI